MHIVSIHAHPDDAEFLAAGTLALLAQAGQRITIVTMTAGDCGSSTLSRADISALRKREAGEAAALIRAEYRCAGFEDLAIFSDDRSRRLVTGLLRDVRPDIILTASPSDYMSDHEATSALVRDACFAASVPNYKSAGGETPLPAIPHLYFMDPIGGKDRTDQTVSPDFTVNVESSFETKRAMLAKHESQHAWLEAQHGVSDYLTQMERWTRECGARGGVALGEGFRQYKVHPYPQNPLLQEMLAGHLAKG